MSTLRRLSSSDEEEADPLLRIKAAARLMTAERTSSSSLTSTWVPSPTRRKRPRRLWMIPSNNRKQQQNDDEDVDSIMSDVTQFSQQQRRAHPYDSELMYQQEAVIRDRAYKRELLGGARAAGLAGGLGLSSPLESPQCGGTRQLKPLSRRTTITKAKLTHPPDQPNSLIARQLTNIVNSCWDLGLPESHRASDSGALYRRLARALDQRAAPADRLFGSSEEISTISSPRRWRWKEQRDFEARQPLWMRGSVSKLLFSNGTDLFHPRHATSLADLDPTV